MVRPASTPRKKSTAKVKAARATKEQSEAKKRVHSVKPKGSK